MAAEDRIQEPVGRQQPVVEVVVAGILPMAAMRLRILAVEAAVVVTAEQAETAALAS